MIKYVLEFAISRLANLRDRCPATIEAAIADPANTRLLDSRPVSPAGCPFDSPRSWGFTPFVYAVSTIIIHPLSYNRMQNRGQMPNSLSDTNKSRNWGALSQNHKANQPPVGPDQPLLAIVERWVNVSDYKDEGVISSPRIQGRCR